jgi:hypothetical protein
MSTLTVTNIKATGETASRGVSGVAAAWCNIQATSGTPTFADSMNFSSITDQGVGDFDPDFTSAMSSVNYAVSSGSNAFGAIDDHMSASPRASTGITINCYFLWTGARDRQNNCAIVMGDLA